MHAQLNAIRAANAQKTAEDDQKSHKQNQRKRQHKAGSGNHHHRHHHLVREAMAAFGNDGGGLSAGFTAAVIAGTVGLAAAVGRTWRRRRDAAAVGRML